MLSTYSIVNSICQTPTSKYHFTCLECQSGAQSFISRSLKDFNEGVDFTSVWPPRWLGGKEPTCQSGDAGSIPGSEGPLEEEMAAHSSILAWETPRTEESGGLQSTGHKELDLTQRLNKAATDHASTLGENSTPAFSIVPSVLGQLRRVNLITWAKKQKVKFCVSRFLFLIVFLFTKVACGNYKIFKNKIIVFCFLQAFSQYIYYMYKYMFTSIFKTSLFKTKHS